MEFPFSMDSVGRDMGGKRVMIASKPKRMYTPTLYLRMRNGGATDEGVVWSVVDGCLHVVGGGFGENHFVFDSLVSLNGVAVAANTHDGTVLCLSKPIGESGWKVCVSTNPSYRATTLPVLLDSIKKSDIDLSRVVVVNGQSQGNSTPSDIGGVRMFESDLSQKGFTALSVVSCLPWEADYWLLLHDTCTINENVKRIGDIDVGLNPDVIYLCDSDESLGMALYSHNFLLRNKDLPGLRPDEIEAELVRRSKVVVSLHSDAKKRRWDVYGTGNVREEVAIPFGITKFKNVSGKGP